MVDGRPVLLVVAGDGPARKSLEQYATTHALPVTFVGNLQQNALPPLYRAADLFITCSTSETYGLTVLEALACGSCAQSVAPAKDGSARRELPRLRGGHGPRCPRCARIACAMSRTPAAACLKFGRCGTPVVLPHCPVFNELWAGRIPDEWRYQPEEEGALVAALRCASKRACKEQLQHDPIKASWADATDVLLAQYQEAIDDNLPYRQAHPRCRATLLRRAARETPPHVTRM